MLNVISIHPPVKDIFWQSPEHNYLALWISRMRRSSLKLRELRLCYLIFWFLINTEGDKLLHLFESWEPLGSRAWSITLSPFPSQSGLRILSIKAKQKFAKGFEMWNLFTTKQARILLWEPGVIWGSQILMGWDFSGIFLCLSNTLCLLYEWYWYL